MSAIVKLTRNIQAQLRNAADLDVWDLVGRGDPDNGTSGTGVGLAGTGSTYTDITNDTHILYLNTGSKNDVSWRTLDVPANGSITTAMLQDNAVSAAKLANSALIDKGLGGNLRTYDNLTNGVQTIPSGVPTGVSRFVQGFALVTETFADGGDTQTTFKIGQTGSDAAYLPTSAFTNAALGTRIPFAGFFNDPNEFIVTAVAKTGAGTGAINVYVNFSISLD